MNPKLFPTILIVLDVLAGVVYATHADLRREYSWLEGAA